MKQNMREVAVLLAEEPPREEKARIKAEALIRDDNLIEAYEILQLECELLSERIKLLESQKDCPPDLVSTISDLIYACPRVDIPELTVIRKQFRAKYGKEFELAAMENRGGVLNERVVSKLSVHPPAAYLVQVCSTCCVAHSVVVRCAYYSIFTTNVTCHSFSMVDILGENCRAVRSGVAANH